MKKSEERSFTNYTQPNLQLLVNVAESRSQLSDLLVTKTRPVFDKARALFVGIQLLIGLTISRINLKRSKSILGLYVIVSDHTQ